MSQQIARGNQETTTTRKDLDLRDKELIKKSQNRCTRFRSKTSTGNSAKVRFQYTTPCCSSIYIVSAQKV